MTVSDITDWDDAYANAAHITGAMDYPPRWAREAEDFRDSWAGKELDVSYGKGERQRFDLFSPEGPSKGLVVFVHGGYWLRFGKSDWSKFARGCLERGWTVCLPGYDLVPSVSIADITRQIAEAVTKAASLVDGVICLSGHSAGGHLVSRLVCKDSPLPQSILGRVGRVVSISGLHDLRPLRNTRMNDAFQLSEAGAMAESPALKEPATGCPVIAWVGEAERPEFIRQSQLLSEAWPNADFHREPEKHHFDVIEDLKDPQSALVSALLGDN